MVSVSGPEAEDVRITPIINWDAATFFPHWWIALKPRYNPGSASESVPAEETSAWVEAFSDALIKEGFDSPIDRNVRAKQYQRVSRALLKVEYSKM